MSLRSPAENEIALTPALSHRYGRGGFSIRRAPNTDLFFTLAHFTGEGRVRASGLRALRGEKVVRQHNRLRCMSVPSLCDGRSFWRRCRFLFLLFGALSPLIEDVEEKRHVNHGESRFADHAAHDAGADGMARIGAGAG